MFHITIVAVGGVRTPHFKDAADEYIKRIKPFAKLEVLEVPAVPFKSEGDTARAKEGEGEKIEEVILKQRGDTFLLDEGGKELNSEEFAKFLATRSEPLTLVIGGTAGLSDGLKKSYKSISLSQLTMPHELARVVLLEQLYRAVTMQQKRNKYHY